MGMSISSIGATSVGKTGGDLKPPQNPEVREAFDAFVGEVFFSQMIKSMRSTVGKAAYFDGGQAEKMFTAQLDQVLSEQMSKASAENFTGPMFELFSLQRM